MASSINLRKAVIQKMKSYPAVIQDPHVISYIDSEGVKKTWRDHANTYKPGTIGVINIIENPTRRTFIGFEPATQQEIANLEENVALRRVVTNARQVPEPEHVVTVPEIIEAPNNPLGDILVSIGQMTQQHAVQKVADAKAKKAATVAKTSLDLKDGLRKTGVYVSDEIANVLAISQLRLETGKHLNVWLRGPSGFGKTTIPREFARHMNCEFVFVNCAAITDPEEWFVIRGVRDQQTVFDSTHLADALQRGNAVILFDEINRAPAWVLNPLLSILDDTKSISIGNTQISVGDGVVFFMTSNEGAEFVGTGELDVALTNRIDMAVIVEELPLNVELMIASDYGFGDEEGRDIVNKIRQIRQMVKSSGIPVDVSTRILVKVLKLVADGLSLEIAATNSITNLVSGDYRRQLYDIVTRAVRQ